MEAATPRLTPTELGERFVEALESAGLGVALESDVGDRPILATVGGQALRVFLWNATPGGPPGVRADDEFRVQTTRPSSVPFLVDDGRQTLLLGYHRGLDVFAGWDVRLHPNPSTSSSLQVPLATLKDAKESGFASNRRDLSAGEQEVVVAFSPESLGTYLELLPPFQEAVVSSSDAPLGERITAGAEPDQDDLPSDEARQVAVQTVARLVRDRRFRTRVIRAYAGRCGFCGVGLGLTDAAHVQAVSDGGSDALSNGVCACPTHHRAFDRGLLGIDDDLSVVINRPLAAELGFDDEEVKQLENGVFDELDAPEGKEPAPERLAYHRAKFSS